MPLGLDDSELELIMAAAARLQPDRRWRFL